MEDRPGGTSFLCGKVFVRPKTLVAGLSPPSKAVPPPPSGASPPAGLWNKETP